MTIRMTTKLTLVIIVTLFITSISISFIFLYMWKSKGETCIIDNIETSQSQKTEVLEKCFLTGLLNDGVVLNKKNEIFDLNGNIVNFNEVINNKSKLIIRFTEFDCDECVKYLLNKIERLFKNQEQQENLIILATYQNRNALNLIIKSLNINAQVFFITEKLSLPAEKYNQPYCFVIDKTLAVNHVFVPDKYLPEVTNQYYEIIKIRYFKNE